MQELTLINVEKRTDADGVLHLLPVGDLIKHELKGCTCGCFRQVVPQGEELQDMIDEAMPEAMPGEFEDFSDLPPHVIVHVAKDGRDRIAEVLTASNFEESIMSRRRYVRHIKNLSEELKWDFIKTKTYLTMMDCAFVHRWNTN